MGRASRTKRERRVQPQRSQAISIPQTTEMSRAQFPFAPTASAPIQAVYRFFNDSAYADALADGDV